MLQVDWKKWLEAGDLVREQWVQIVGSCWAALGAGGAGQGWLTHEIICVYPYFHDIFQICSWHPHDILSSIQFRPIPCWFHVFQARLATGFLRGCGARTFRGDPVGGAAAWKYMAGREIYRKIHWQNGGIRDDVSFYSRWIKRIIFHTLPDAKFDQINQDDGLWWWLV